MIELLSRVSRDVWELTYTGNVERLREVLGAEPDRAKVVWEGETPLMFLPPDDEARAVEVVKLLLAHGADPTIRNSKDWTRRTMPRGEASTKPPSCCERRRGDIAADQVLACG